MIKKENLPDNWNINSFTDCIDQATSPAKFKIQKKDYKDEGSYAIIDQSVDYIAGYTDDSEKIFEEGLPVVIFGDHTRIFKYVDFPFALGADGAKILIPKIEIIDAKYFYFFLKGLVIEDHGYDRHYKYLKEKQIVVPPLETQKEIVEILERAERLKEWRTEADELTDEFLKSIFLEMFGDINLNTKNWKTKKINDLADVQTGGTPNRKINEYWDDGIIPWVKTTEVNGYIINEADEFITEAGLKNSNARMFPKDSILVAMYGQGKTRGKSGKLGIDASTNQACAAILPSKTYNTDYLWYFLRMSYDNLRKLGRGGNQPNLNLTMIKNFEVFYPPLDLQNQFAEFIKQIEIVKTHQKHSKQQIEDFFKAIMQKSFKGELTC